jgi:hypothetical protein
MPNDRAALSSGNWTFDLINANLLMSHTRIHNLHPTFHIKQPTTDNSLRTNLVKPLKSLITLKPESKVDHILRNSLRHCLLDVLRRPIEESVEVPDIVLVPSKGESEESGTSKHYQSAPPLPWCH